MADRGEPAASCSEWHGDGTAGEDEPGSGLAAMVAQLRRWARSVPGRPSGSLAGGQAPAEWVRRELPYGMKGKAADGFSVLRVSLGFRSPTKAPYMDRGQSQAARCEDRQ